MAIGDITWDSGNTFSSVDDSFFKTFSLDGSAFIVFYHSSNNLFARARTSSWGTALEIGAASIFFDVVKIDSTRFGVVYKGSSGTSTVRIVSVSGNTVSAHTALTYASTGTTVDKITTTGNRLITHHHTGTAATAIRSYLISDTTLTFEHSTAIGSTQQYVSGSALCSIDSSKFAFLRYNLGATDHFYLRIYECGASSLTQLYDDSTSMKTHFSDNNIAQPQMICLSSSNIIITFQSSTTNNRLLIGSFLYNGTNSVSYVTRQTISTVSATNSRLISLQERAFALAYQINTSNHLSRTGSISTNGDTFTLNTTNTLSVSNSNVTFLASHGDGLLLSRRTTTPSTVYHIGTIEAQVVDFPYTGSGTITTSGSSSSLFTYDFPYTPTGSITTSGTAPHEFTSELHFTYIASGSCSLSGSIDSIYSNDYTYSSSGNISITGETENIFTWDYIYSCSGGILVSGEAIPHFVASYEYTVSGSIITSGEASFGYQLYYEYVMTGNRPRISGTADYIPSFDGYLPLTWNDSNGFITASSFYSVVRLDATRFVILYRHGEYSSLYLRVGHIQPDYSILYDEPVFFRNYNGNDFSMAKIAENKIFIAYERFVIIATVDSNGITLFQEVNVQPPLSNNLTGIVVCSSNIIIYRGVYKKIITINHVNNTISSVSNLINDAENATLYSSGNNTFIALKYEPLGQVGIPAGSTLLRVATLSGGNITYGAEKVLHLPSGATNATATSFNVLTYLTSSKIALSYRVNWSTLPYTIVGTISGSTITLGEPVQLPLNVNTSINAISRTGNNGYSILYSENKNPTDLLSINYSSPSTTPTQVNNISIVSKNIRSGAQLSFENNIYLAVYEQSLYQIEAKAAFEKSQFVYMPSGTITPSGTAQVIFFGDYGDYIGSGNITITGEALYEEFNIYEYSSSGSIITSGSSPFQIEYIHEASGNVYIIGEALYEEFNIYEYSSSGSIITSGSSPFQIEYIHEASGNVYIIGAADVFEDTRDFLYTCSGIITILGSALYEQYDENSYVPTGSILVSGESDYILYTKHFEYITNGIINMSGDADCQEWNDYTYISEGNISITGETENIFTWNYSYIASGSIITSGSSPFQIEYIHEASGNVYITGAANYIENENHYVYNPTGEIDITGLAPFSIDYNYTGEGSILVSGEGYFGADYEYDASGSIYITGEAHSFPALQNKLVIRVYAYITRRIKTKVKVVKGKLDSNITRVIRIKANI